MPIPEDGHRWKKYGQKFIKKIKRIRCYFKCRSPGCRAKKRVEWPPSDPDNLRVVYEGTHQHPPPAPSLKQPEREASASTSAAANQYDLVSQVLGGLSGDASN